jgi:hypothetical protein
MQRAGAAGISTEDDKWLDASPVVLIEPENWLGLRWPLLRYIDIGEQLAQGTWNVVLYHPNCAECREVIKELTTKGVGEQPRLALIEVPPHQSTLTSGPRWTHGRLTTEKQWVLTPPVQFALRDGIVRKSAAVAQAFVDYRRLRRDNFLKTVACGPYALLTVMKSLGIAVPQREKEEILAAAGNTGMDMLQLQELAENHGLHAKGVSLSAGQLRSLNLPAIIHIDGGTFAAVTRYMRDGFRMTDASGKAFTRPTRQFEQTFGNPGNALLLSTSPIDAKKLGIEQGRGQRPEGPRFHLSRTVLAVGRTCEARWERSLTLTNTGTEPLRIIAIKPSCDCLTATTAKYLLHPSEQTQLSVVGEMRELGPFDFHISIVTNQPGSTAYEVPVRGYFENPVFALEPRALFPQVPVNDTASVKVPVEASPEIPIRDLTASIPDGAPLTATFSDAAGERTLRLDWKGMPTPGVYRYRVTLGLLSLPSSFWTPLYVTANVVPLVQAVPSIIHLREAELSEACTRRVKLDCHGVSPTALALSWSAPEFAEHFDASLVRSGRALELTLKPRWPSGTQRLCGKSSALHFVASGGRVGALAVCVGTNFSVTKEVRELLIDSAPSSTDASPPRRAPGTTR